MTLGTRPITTGATITMVGTGAGIAAGMAAGIVRGAIMAGIAMLYIIILPALAVSAADLRFLRATGRSITEKDRLTGMAVLATVQR